MMFSRAVPAIAALALLAACGQSNAPAASTNPDVKISPALEDVILGDPNAPVKIVEYGSLACPHCRDFWMQQMPKLKPVYIDTGKANYTFRDLTLGGAAALSDASAAIARCAGKDKYYAAVQAFFDRQYDIAAASATPGGAGPIMAEIGAGVGLSREQVLACIDSPAIAAYIVKQRNEKPADVSGLPTIIVNGEVVKGADPGKELQGEDVAKVIDAKLGGAAPATKPPG
jgi:protein-disulfide isomerase